PGLDDVLDQIRDRMLGSGFAELDAGRLLWVRGIPFKYIETVGTLGCDYDLELSHWNGIECCGEVKSKDEKTALSERTILASLKEARDQLPKDRPGVVFLKVPQSWSRDKDCLPMLNRAVKSLKSS